MASRWWSRSNQEGAWFGDRLRPRLEDRHVWRAILYHLPSPATRSVIFDLQTLVLSRVHGTHHRALPLSREENLGIPFERPARSRFQ